MAVNAPATPQTLLSPVVAVVTDGSIPAKVNVELAGFSEAEQMSLKNQALEAIAAEGISESLGDDDPQIYVKITGMGEYNDEGYELAIDAIAESRSLAGQPIEAQCELCTEGELSTKIREEFRKLRPTIVQYLEDRDVKRALAAREAAAAKQNQPESPPTTPPPGGPPTSDDPDEGMSSTGKAGIGMMAVGGVGTAIGLGLTLNSPKQRNEDKGWELISTRPPGAALLAIGGVTLVTGVALFIVDRQRRQQRRSALTPVVGPGVAGVSWAGRF
ncbi:MAG: hypothetical protein H6713_33190 [Myxococcales bacterium]|nr:hypothetical protein [Myxococcales bacterium]MCB9754817.1 hypothetical protein [Myxococcales bacterium]